MSEAFANMEILRVVIHDIYSRNEDRDVQEPGYSEELAALDQSGFDLLRERVVSALGSDSHCLEMEIFRDESEGTFQVASRAINSRDDKFIFNSKKLALMLATAQNSRRIPGGIVLVFTGKTGPEGNKFLGIIKAETQKGFTKVKKGQKLTLSFLDNLLLTPQQKLYKIGVFVEVQKSPSTDGGRSPMDFKAYVYDHQMDKAETRKAALYFYETFLGCNFTPTHKKMTRDFYFHTKEFINNRESNDEKRYDLGNSLYTYLKVSQSEVISVDDFAKQYMPAKQRDEYRGFMKDKEFPMGAVNKDIGYIKSNLKKRRFTFSSKVKIFVPDGNGLDSNHLIEFFDKETVDGRVRTIVKIEGTLEKEE